MENASTDLLINTTFALFIVALGIALQELDYKAAGNIRTSWSTRLLYLVVPLFMMVIGFILIGIPMFLYFDSITWLSMACVLGVVTISIAIYSHIFAKREAIDILRLLKRYKNIFIGVSILMLLAYFVVYALWLQGL
jgi:hypothetical protein